MVASSSSLKVVNMTKNVSAYEAANYLGCSYPHIIHLIRKNKIKAQKIRKQWFVDLGDLEHAKSTHLVNPRPRSGKPKTREVTQVYASPENASAISESRDSVEIKLSIPKEKYALVNTALFGSSQKTLKQTLEMKVDDLFLKLQKQLESVDL